MKAKRVMDALWGIVVLISVGSVCLFGVCSSMTTSTMRPANDFAAFQGCGDDLLPQSLDCTAAYLPNLEENKSEVEVELWCSWATEYPVQALKFQHGFDIIDPQLELADDMAIISRQVFQASEADLSVVGFFCAFSYLHPLCGPIEDFSPCSISRAKVRVDPLVQEVHEQETAQVTCTRRPSDEEDSDSSNTMGNALVNWESRPVTQNVFAPVVNGSRLTVSADGGVLTMSSLRLRDDFTMFKCYADGDTTTKNFGLSQLRVEEGTLPETTTVTQSTTTPNALINTSSERTSTVSSTETPIRTTAQVPNRSPWWFFLDYLYITIPILVIPVILIIVICIVVAIARRRLRKKTAGDRSPEANHGVNDNTYAYMADDDAIEHEYLQSCDNRSWDGTSRISQHSEYVNEGMLNAGMKGRTTRMLRSKSDTRLAQVMDDIPMQEIPRSRSAWALPGLSTAETSVFNRPMPEMPSRKRSMTASGSMMRPPLPPGRHPANRPASQAPGEYALIDEGMLSRSFEKASGNNASPYACTQLHTRSHTMDPKLFIPKRNHKK